MLCLVLRSVALWCGVLRGSMMCAVSCAVWRCDERCCDVLCCDLSSVVLCCAVLCCVVVCVVV